MAYTPPVGDVVFDFLDGYSPPVGDVDLSILESQSIYITDSSLTAQAAISGEFVPPHVAVNGSLAIVARLGGSVSYIHVNSSLAANAALGGAGKIWYNVFISDGSLNAEAFINGDAYPQYLFRWSQVEIRQLVQVETLRLVDVSDTLRMIPEGD